MSMPVLEYCTFVPGSKSSGHAAAIAAVCRSGAPPDQPPPLMAPCFAQISNGNPPVWFKTMRTVSVFFARTSLFTPFELDSRTQSSLNSGRYFETGSSSVILPSSTRIATVTPQKPFVCEHCM